MLKIFKCVNINLFEEKNWKGEKGRGCSWTLPVQLVPGAGQSLQLMWENLPNFARKLAKLSWDRNFAVFCDHFNNNLSKYSNWHILFLLYGNSGISGVLLVLIETELIKKERKIVANSFGFSEAISISVVLLLQKERGRLPTLNQLPEAPIKSCNWGGSQHLFNKGNRSESSSVRLYLCILLRLLVQVMASNLHSLIKKPLAWLPRQKQCKEGEHLIADVALGGHQAKWRGEGEGGGGGGEEKGRPGTSGSWSGTREQQFLWMAQMGSISGRSQVALEAAVDVRRYERKLP